MASDAQIKFYACAARKRECLQTKTTDPSILSRLLQPRRCLHPFCPARPLFSAFRLSAAVQLMKTFLGRINEYISKSWPSVAARVLSPFLKTGGQVPGSSSRNWETSGQKRDVLFEIFCQNVDNHPMNLSAEGVQDLPNPVRGGRCGNGADILKLWQ